MNRLECYQAASAAYDEYVCGGERGRAKTDPVYQMVCEKRDIPPNYKFMSTCADRCHDKLWQFGCRKPFVNREERTPNPNDWKNGANIAWLHDIGKGSPVLFEWRKINGKDTKIAVPPGIAWSPMVGDELIIWNHPLGKDAHSLSIVAFDGALARTGNYGASGMSAAVFPGARVAVAPLVLENGAWHYGDKGKRKKVMRVLRIEDYIEALEAKADLSGIPHDSRYTGEVQDLIEKERA